jgi:hypothetical protein
MSLAPPRLLNLRFDIMEGIAADLESRGSEGARALTFHRVQCLDVRTQQRHSVGWNGAGEL